MSAPLQIAIVDPGPYLAGEPGAIDFLVNTGDLLRRWTNERIRSAPHSA